ncbi:hypothetical protein ASC77_24570 [Nocardioides sp. Root1257]|uniref:DUF7144 family membrane protein n=1 Tax=unclassified Nocardioides TaxID=2615069 RepID=UPI0006FE6303|nr:MULTISPECIES: hypothetical protein [unclassified Nocardioides]KQW52550.1 hypothetical protein ASC77_24570 [Nocardioides sp. Root1257]KRC54613.1 hypothetical protein ASE24_24360 [Nocardioides sp. Root224]
MSPESRNDIDYSTRGMAADFTATFAGVLLVITGGFDVLQGLSAIANDDLYAAGSEYLYKLDMTAWGTVHLIIGIVSIVVGVGITTRASWAPVCGMVIAGLAMLTNFAFLPLYPFWAIVIIAFNGLVIWALSVQLRNYQR